MRTATYFTALLAVLSSTGCIFGKHKQQPPPPAVVDLSPSAPTTPANTNTFRITPDQTVRGRVTSVNDNLRFVVVSFPLEQIPPLGSLMNVYRNGTIVGEIKITGPQRDDNTVADMVVGDARKGDEVRPK